jgi:hypothetical protein
MTTESWMITDPDADWDSDWEGSARWRRRMFRRLSMADKIRAVEEMCRLAKLLDANRKSRMRSPAPEED